MPAGPPPTTQQVVSKVWVGMSVILFCSSDPRRTADPLRQAQGRLSAPLRCARDDNLTSWNQITGLEGRGLQQGCGSRVRRFKLGPRGAVPTGLGFFFYAYPALKGGANKHRAYGAGDLAGLRKGFLQEFPSSSFPSSSVEHPNSSFPLLKTRVMRRRRGRARDWAGKTAADPSTRRCGDSLG